VAPPGRLEALEQKLVELERKKEAILQQIQQPK
jgi:hypothetical protein